MSETAKIIERVKPILIPFAHAGKAELGVEEAIALALVGLRNQLSTVQSRIRNFHRLEIGLSVSVLVFVATGAVLFVVGQKGFGLLTEGIAIVNGVAKFYVFDRIKDARASEKEVNDSILNLVAMTAILENLIEDPSELTRRETYATIVEKIFKR